MHQLMHYIIIEVIGEHCSGIGSFAMTRSAHPRQVTTQGMKGRRAENEFMCIFVHDKSVAAAEG